MVVVLTAAAAAACDGSVLLWCGMVSRLQPVTDLCSGGDTTDGSRRPYVRTVHRHHVWLTTDGNML